MKAEAPPAGRQLTKLTKLLDAAVTVAQDAPGFDNRAYLARALILSTLPHRRPKGTTFTRTSGRATMTMTALSPAGLPFGSYPRLFLCWACTEAVRTRSRVLEMGTSYRGFLRELDLREDGTTMRLFKTQVERLLTSAVSIAVEDDTLHATARQNMVIASRYLMFWDVARPAQLALFGSNVVELSTDFYEEVVASPVPLDTRCLKALKASPLALDVYCWGAYVAPRLDKPRVVPWKALRMQFGAEYARARDFKAAFTEALRAVRTVYPIRTEAGVDGLTVHPGKPSIPAR